MKVEGSGELFDSEINEIFTKLKKQEYDQRSKCFKRSENVD